MDIAPVTARQAASSPSDIRAIGAPGSAGAVKTELPRAATVEQAPPPRNAQPDARQSVPAQRSESYERRFEFDPVTHALILREVDPRSGDVVRQVPDDAMLRIQAYASALRRASAFPGRDESSVERIA